MGKSFTYNLYGMSIAHTDERNENKHHDVYPCMTKLDMVRARKEAKKRGQVMESWEAQTRQGEHMLGSSAQYDTLIDLSHIKTVTCPKCAGDGCGICDFSGITTKRDLNRYMAWQLVPDLE